MLEMLWQDLRYGFRLLIKSPGFTGVAVATLALGIGINTAIFSVVYAVLLRPLPYQEPERLVRIYERSPQFDLMSIAYPNFLDWRDQNRSFEQIAAVRSTSFTVTRLNGAERIRGKQVSANFFSLLGVKPLLGRTFLPEEDHLGGNPVVMISHGLWQRRFGSDASLIGKAITLDGKSYTVVGILPSNFQFYDRADLFTPIGLWDDAVLYSREFHPGIQAVGRLKPGVTIGHAQAEMDQIARRLAEEYPQTNTGYGVAVRPLHEDMVGDIRLTLLLLFGAVGFVLLIACANLANLLLAKSVTRRREIAIRMALGASRARILRQLLTESLSLSLLGGLLGLLVGVWGTNLFILIIPEDFPRVQELGVNLSVPAFTLMISLLTGMVFGIAPALETSRLNLNESLKEGGRGAPSGRPLLRDLLVISEVSLAFVLLIGAGLMIRTLVRLYEVRLGFDAKDIVTMKVGLSGSDYSEPSKIRVFYQQLLQRVESLADVQAAALTANLPFAEDTEVPFWVEGRARPAPEEMYWALLYPVSHDYLGAMGIRLLRGRFFADRDTEKTPEVVVVDEVLASSLFPNEDPIGKRIVIGDAGGPREIVGVVDHVIHWGLDTDAQAKIRFQLYIPYLQIPDQFLPLVANATSLLVRTKSTPQSIASAVRRQAQTVDENQAIYEIRTMEQIIAGSISRQRILMMMLGAFAGGALFLAALGLYGILSYSVTQRTHEIGIRMALGAQQRDIFKLVVGQGLILAMIGIAVGLAAAFALTRIMSNLLYRTSATDPITFVVISLLLTGVTLLASYIPACKATKVDPLVTLRYE